MALHCPADYRARRLNTSYWSVFTEPELKQVTLGEALRQTADASPDRLALVEGSRNTGRSWTYSALLDRSLRTARALLARFEPGERVAFWAPNVPEWIPALYGCALAGITLVTVNPAYKRRELEYVLAKSRAAGLFMSQSYRGFDMEAALAEARPALPDLRQERLLALADDHAGRQAQDEAGGRQQGQQPDSLREAETPREAHSLTWTALTPASSAPADTYAMALGRALTYATTSESVANSGGGSSLPEKIRCCQ